MRRDAEFQRQGRSGQLEKSGDLITTNMEPSDRVQELEQQIVDLKAEPYQKEVESEGFEDADSVIASRDLLNLDETVVE
jgi:hypothetical protein